MKVAAQANDCPTDVEVRAALARIASSSAFRGAPKLTAFLRFIVGRALAGDGGSIKGYTVAVEALGRGPNFDPQTDTIVRVDAGRLRRALGRFYALEGLDDAIVIELLRGSYVPRFHLRPQRARPLAAPAGQRDADDEPRAPLHDADALHKGVQELIGLCRLQLQAMSAAVATVEQIFEMLRASRN